MGATTRHGPKWAAADVDGRCPARPVYGWLFVRQFAVDVITGNTGELDPSRTRALQTASRGGRGCRGLTHTWGCSGVFTEAEDGGAGEGAEEGEDKEAEAQ